MGRDVSPSGREPCPAIPGFLPRLYGYNVGMRIARCVWILAWCTFRGMAQDLPPYVLPADVAAKVRALTPGEPLHLLAALASMDLQRRAAAEELWQALDVRSQCAMVRAGLRADDTEVAIGAVAKADEGRWLDTREQKRAATIGMGRCNVENTPLGVGEFFHMLDAKDTALFLANPGEMPREVPQFLGALHHRFGPEHQAQIEQLTRSDDVLLRQDAAKYFGVVKLERARYAHFLLSQPPKEEEFPDTFDPQHDKSPFVPRPVVLRPAGEGYPPLLAAVLERVFLSGAEPSQGDRVFAWRWARDSKAGEVDRAQLIALLGSETDEGQRVGVLGLQQLGAADRGALLTALAAQADGESLAPLQALAELVRGGDAVARQTLASLAEPHPLAFSMLWSADRERAMATVALAMGDDAERGLLALQHLELAANEGELWGDPMVGLDQVLRERSAAAPLDGARLGFLFEQFPAVRSVALGQRTIAAITAETVPAMPLGALELADAAALAKALQQLLVVDEVQFEVRELAVRGLAALGRIGLGEPTQAARLWSQAAQLNNEETRAKARIWLAEIRDPTVSTLLLAETKDAMWYPGWETAGLVGALAAASGLDRRLALAFAQDLHEFDIERMSGLRTQLLELLRTGRASEAIVRYLADRPLERGGFDFLWLLPDPAGRAYLQRCREEREFGLYCWATGELARGGDAAARAEVESAIERRLYGWIDDFSADVLTDGNRLERVPLLLRQVDSNCCTLAVVGTALEEVFEFETDLPEHGIRSRPARIQAAWQRCQGQLQWSRIANRWLIAPK